MREELTDRFGPIPPPALNLLEAMKLKQLLTRLRVRKLNLSEERAVIAFDDSSEISPQGIVGLVQENKDRYQFTPSFELILSMDKGGWQEALGKTKNTLEELVQYAKLRGIPPIARAPEES